MNKQLFALNLAIVLALSGCGGGGGSEQGENNSDNGNETTPKPPSENNNEQFVLLKQLRTADAASELNPSTFGLDEWNPRAIARDGDVLYIANSNEKSQILRYDLKTKTVLTAIDPEKITGILKPWNTLNDISIYKGRLYVSSFPSSRVDVLDISTGTPQYVMALGTGQWWGDTANSAIVHTHSVTANDNYVFSADMENRINVWSQSQVVAANSLKARKYARLVLPKCERNCVVRLETVGNLLYANLSNGNTFVYDVSNLQQGAVDVAATRQQTGIASVGHLANDGLLYALRSSGAVETYPSDQLTTISDVLPNAIDRIASYRVQGQDQSQSLAKTTDLAVYENNLMSLVNNKVIIMPLRALLQRKTANVANPLQLQQAQKVSSYKMLQDGESWETLTNPNLRHVMMNEILSATLNSDTVQLQSYSAIPVSDLEIQARLKGTEQWMVLAKLDQLDAFSNVSLKLKINDDSRFNLIDGSGSIQLAGLSQLNQLPSDLFDLKIASQTDMHVQKLSKIKAKWNIYFGTYNPEADSKWLRITPLYAREWVIMMTNFAYTLSSPEFEHLWFNHKKVMGYDFFGNGGMIDGENGYFKDADYTRVYQEIFDRGGISLGITNMGGGLGGGAVLGVDPWIYYGHYRWSGLGIVAHEFGHHWGNHSSAWSNGNYGFQPMIGDLHFYMQHQNDLPYLDPNANKLHLANAADLYGSVSANIVNKAPNSSPWNKIDQYFADYPLKK